MEIEDPFIANMMKGFFLLFLIMILCIYITVFSQMNQVNNSNSNGNNNEIAVNSLLLQENRIQSNSVSDKSSLLRAAQFQHRPQQIKMIPPLIIIIIIT